MSLQKMTVAVLMAALTLGCSSPGSIPVVQSEYWKDHEFDAFARYAWLASDVANAEQAQSVAPRTHGLIQRMIDQRLAAKGFVQSAAGEADLLVTFQFDIAEKTNVERIDKVWVGGAEDYAGWEKIVPRIEYSSFDEGAIVIDFLKPGNDEPVWRGVGRGRVSRDVTPEQLDTIVSQSVRSILSEFPPKT